MNMVSTAPLFGAVIEKAPQDWQILQQVNGGADIYLAGKWYIDQKSGNEKVYARVVEECTGSVVIHWTESKAVGDNGWEVTLRHVPAGGLYRIETCLDQGYEELEWAYRGDMVEHVGVGDLYVIAGQSNAAGFGRDPIEDMPELGIHMYKHRGIWDIAAHPLSDPTGTLHPVNRERVNPGHSPYLSFARQLKRKLGYPIGLIPTAKGGSALQRWNPAESGELYRNMMNTIKDVGEKIKGILWYQGCGDTGTPERYETYLDRFRNLVKEMRTELYDAELPILTVQLNRYADAEVTKNDTGWGTVKEAQRQAAKQISNVYVTPAIDASVCDIIHNSAASNIVIGERLAKLALRYIYGRAVLCDAPEISRAVKEEGSSKVSLTFENVVEKLNFRKAAAGKLLFMIEDDQGCVQITGYQIMRNMILLELDRKLVGKAYVSCAAGACPEGQIPFDSMTFLPLLAFYRVAVS